MGIAQSREQLAVLVALFALGMIQALLPVAHFVPRRRSYAAWPKTDAVVLRYEARLARTSGIMGKGIDHLRVYSLDLGGTRHDAEGPDVSDLSGLDDIAPGAHVTVAYNPANPAEALSWSDIVHPPYLTAHCIMATIFFVHFGVFAVAFARRRRRSF